ncbi:FG-GAP repeat protein, partial [Strigomonas culicis]
MRSRDIAVVFVALLLFVVLWYQEETVQFSPHCALYDAAEVAQSGGEEGGVAQQLQLRLMPPRPIVLSYTAPAPPGASGRRRRRTLLVHAGLSNEARTRVAFTELTRGTPHRHRGELGACVPRGLPVVEHDLHSRVIGLGTGTAGAPTESLPASTLVAVVTANYYLHLLTPEGAKLWSINVAPPACYTHADFATVVVLPERVNKDDQGVVAVAMPAVDANGVAMMLYAAFNAADGALRWRYLSDSGSDLDDVIREAEQSPDADLWEAQTFQRAGGNSSTAAPAGVQQGRAKADGAFVVAPVQRHYEQPWTTYRQAVIAALPHRFAHLWDAELRPHIFYRSKGRKVASSRHGPRQSTMTFFRQEGRARGQRQVLRLAEEDYGELGERMAAWAKQLQAKTGETRKGPSASASRGAGAAPTPANTLVFHGPHGMEAVHLYTGSIVTSLQPLKSMHTVYDDINDDYYIEAISTTIGARVAPHSQHGVELVRDCLGTVETGVPVAEELLLNVTICDSVGFLGNLDGLRQFLYGEAVDAGDGAVDTLALFGSQNVVDDTTQSTVP